MSSTTPSDTLSELKSAGWIVIAAGAISIVAGILAIAYPDITLLALAIFAGVNLIVLGVMSLIDAFTEDGDSGARALSAILGVSGLIAGLVVLRRPGESLLAIVLVVGIWFVVSGAVAFFRALSEQVDRGVRLLAALCELVLGALILALPDLSLRTVAILAGISFIVRGAVAVWGGWHLHKAGAHPSRLAPAA